MGLFDFLLRLFFGKRSSPAETARPQATDRRRARPRLVPLRAVLQKSWTRNATLDVKEPPYAFARLGIGSGQFLDLSQDADDERLARSCAPRVPYARATGRLARHAVGPLGMARPPFLGQLASRDRGRGALSLPLAAQAPRRASPDRIAQADAQRGAAQDPGRNPRPGSAARRRSRIRPGSLHRHQRDAARESGRLAQVRPGRFLRDGHFCPRDGHLSRIGL